MCFDAVFFLFLLGGGDWISSLATQETSFGVFSHAFPSHAFVSHCLSELWLFIGSVQSQSPQITWALKTFFLNSPLWKAYTTLGMCTTVLFLCLAVYNNLCLFPLSLVSMLKSILIKLLFLINDSLASDFFFPLYFSMDNLCCAFILINLFCDVKYTTKFIHYIFHLSHCELKVLSVWPLYFLAPI